MYYKVITTSTSKPCGRTKEEYQTFDSSSENFKTIEEVKNFLQEKYQSCKKVPVYRDKIDGTTEQVGWIYCFRNKDYSHNSKSWNQQDWVEVRELQEKSILI